MVEAELWTQACEIEKELGELASAWKAEQIVAFMRTGNHEAEQRMRRINEQLMQLQHGHFAGCLPQRYASRLS